MRRLNKSDDDDCAVVGFWWEAANGWGWEDHQKGMGIKYWTLTSKFLRESLKHEILEDFCILLHETISLYNFIKDLKVELHILSSN